MTAEHQRLWEPLSPDDIAALFSKATFPWWIAGGYAIEDFVGRPLRSHGDIDVLLFHSDQHDARSMLADWDCWAADPPGSLRPWEVGETLPLQVSDIWCREDHTAPWRFQLMLDQGSGSVWRSRRCPLLSKSVIELTRRSTTGIPFLAPEIQLFYKAESPRRKDELDFSAALPLLSTSQIVWLRKAISMTYGEDNAWLASLDT
jgi:hypothetical protein